MKRTQWCRVCEQTIGFYGFPNHVLMHKRQFCRDKGFPESQAGSVRWEVVVIAYNSKNAKTELSWKKEHFINRKLHEFGDVV